MLAQVFHFALVVNRQEPNEVLLFEAVVDDPQPASLPFAALLIGPASLAKAARALDDGAKPWILRQGELQKMVAVVIKVVLQKPGEERSLDELH